MQFGIMLDSQYAKDGDIARRIDEMVLLTERARDAGYESLFAVHHYLASNVTLQPLPTLARLIPHSGTMRLGTGVYFATVEHPIRLAENTATIDQLSGGRLTLGLGAGYRREEFDATGIERATRWSRLAETVELVEALWTGETGEPRRPALRRAGPAAQRRAGAAAAARPSGSAPTGPPRCCGPPPSATPGSYRPTSRRSGRWGTSPPSGPSRSDWAGPAPTASARSCGSSSSPTPTPRPSAWRWTSCAASTRTWPSTTSTTSCRCSTTSRRKAFLIGSPETVRAGIEELAAAGFDHVIFRVRWADMPVELAVESLERCARDVLPAFADSPLNLPARRIPTRPRTRRSPASAPGGRSAQERGCRRPASRASGGAGPWRPRRIRSGTRGRAVRRRAGQRGRTRSRRARAATCGRPGCRAPHHRRTPGCPRRCRSARGRRRPLGRRWSRRPRRRPWPSSRRPRR